MQDINNFVNSLYLSFWSSEEQPKNLSNNTILWAVAAVAFTSLAVGAGIACTRKPKATPLPFEAEKIQSFEKLRSTTVAEATPVIIETNPPISEELKSILPTLIEKKQIPSCLIVKESDGGVNLEQTVVKIKQATVSEYAYMLQFLEIHQDENQPFLGLLAEITPKQVGNPEGEFAGLCDDNAIPNQLNEFRVGNLNKIGLANYTTPLLVFAHAGNLVAVEALLTCGANPYLKSPNALQNDKRNIGPTPMEFAIKQRNLQLVELLLKHLKDPKDIDRFSDSQKPALSQAITVSTAIAETLIDAGASVTAPDFGGFWVGTTLVNDGNRPLSYAVDAGDLVIFNKIMLLLSPEEQISECLLAANNALGSSPQMFDTLMEKIPQEDKSKAILKMLNNYEVYETAQQRGRKAPKQTLKKPDLQRLELLLSSLKKEDIDDEINSQVVEKFSSHRDVLELLAEHGFDIESEEDVPYKM